MAANSPTSQQAPSGSSWTDPPWMGWIDTTGDALLILEAARRGLIPRVTRRLVDSERKMITSGSVFVFDEDESGIKRWTDGFFWSPSRILGNFLLYRETEKRGSGHKGKSESSSSGEHSHALLVNEQQYGDGKPEGHALSRPKGDVSLGIDRQRERNLVGSLTNSYKFKPDGMMKKTFSLTIGGVSQHLISYYKIEDVEQGRLRTPSSLPELMALDISPEYLEKTNFRTPPKVEVGYDGVPRYRGEADEAAPSPRTTTAPLSTHLPLLSSSRTPAGADSDEIPPTPTVGKRAKRNESYNPISTSKRSKKVKSPASHDGDAHSPTSQASPAMSPTYGAGEQGHSVQPYYSTYSLPPPGYYHPGYSLPPHGYPTSPVVPGTPSPSGSGSHTTAPPSSTPAPAQPAPYAGYQHPMAGDPNQPQGYTYYPPHPHGHYPAYGWNQYQYPMQGMPPPPQASTSSDAKGSDTQGSSKGNDGDGAEEG